MIAAGEVDLAVCYCSVFDECWTAAPRPAAVEVHDCDGAPRSGV